MPWHERDYYREDTLSGRFGSSFRGFGSKSVVTWLIVINVVVFLFEQIFDGAARIPMWAQPMELLGFRFDQTFHHLQLWRLVTYQFVHDGWLHIIFNMFALYFLGPMLEQWLGSRRFLAFYLLCGISGAIVMSILGAIPGLLAFGLGGNLIGASGSIFGILVADAVVFPRQQFMLIFPPIPLTVRTLALVALGFAVLIVIVGGPDPGGQACHLGGAALGFVLIKFPASLDWADGRWFKARPGRGLKDRLRQRQKQADRREQQEVDRILDKVRQQGLQSLTRREKKVLSRATQRQNRPS